MSNELVTTNGAASSGIDFSREDLALVSGDAFGEQPSILPEADIDRELKAIADLRRTNRKEYNRDNALHLRERELLAMKARWDDSNSQHRRWTTRAAQILRNVPDSDKFERGFDSMWSNLSEISRDALRYELALPATEYPARPASADDVKRFAESDVGAELVREWAGQAPKKLALIRSRSERLMRVDLEAGFEWFEDLPKAQAKAVLKIMAGA
jgi:hypothetical protein